MRNSRLIIYSRVLWFSLFALTLGGCVAARVEKNIQTSEEIGQVKENRSIVFGQIEWLEHGKTKKIGHELGSELILEPHLLNLENENIVIGFPGEDGRFVWSLEAGRYLIKRIVYQAAGSGNYIITPKVAFSVPENGKIYYFGKLKCESEPKRDFLGKISGKVRFQIQDEGNEEIKAFQDKYNFDPNKIEKSLMVHDSSIPDSVDSAIELNKAITIIDAILFGVSH